MKSVERSVFAHACWQQRDRCAFRCASEFERHLFFGARAGEQRGDTVHTLAEVCPGFADMGGIMSHPWRGSRAYPRGIGYLRSLARELKDSEVSVVLSRWVGLGRAVLSSWEHVVSGLCACL